MTPSPGGAAHAAASTPGEGLPTPGRLLNVLLVALAPEVDLRYERLYGCIEDDVKADRRRASAKAPPVVGTVRGR